MTRKTIIPVINFEKYVLLDNYKVTQHLKMNAKALNKRAIKMLET